MRKEFRAIGSVGVVSDSPEVELPDNAWTNGTNIRFLDGALAQTLGYNAPFGTPPILPLHVLPVVANGARYWVYAGTQKIYVTTVTGGSPVHTNVTRQTTGVDVNYTGAANQWTSCVLGGVPILNAGNTVDPPQMWNLVPANRATALSNWPANTYCKSLRAFKNILIALNVTKTTTNYPYMVKWSHPADPGAVPISWDPADTTKDAGEFDLSEGYDQIIDGLSLRDSFMVYKEQSVWRLDYVGGQFVLRSSKVMGMSGAMNRNCITEIDGFHIVLTTNDVVLHDGVQATTILNATMRRRLFKEIDGVNQSKCFVFKNPFFNEVYICYPSVGNDICDKAMVYNYVEKTVSPRDIPNLNHAAFGAVDNDLIMTWDADGDPWASDYNPWAGSDQSPSISRVLAASNNTKLYLIDGSITFDGVQPNGYIERRGLSFGTPEEIKYINSIQPRVMGQQGATIKVSVGKQDYPDQEPVYQTKDFVIGQDVVCWFDVAGRYIAIKIEGGTAFMWRVSSYTAEVEILGDW